MKKVTFEQMEIIEGGNVDCALSAIGFGMSALCALVLIPTGIGLVVSTAGMARSGIGIINNC